MISIGKGSFITVVLGKDFKLSVTNWSKTDHNGAEQSCQFLLGTQGTT